jgi:hypothetical protein
VATQQKRLLTFKWFALYLLVVMVLDSMLRMGNMAQSGCKKAEKVKAA